MFTWDITKCDTKVYNGKQVMMCANPNKICNEFIVNMSNEIGCKLDYFNAAGRNIIGCYAEDYEKVSNYLHNLKPDFFDKYDVDHAGYILY